MQQPLAHINPQVTPNQAFGLIRYYDQMKQSPSPVVQSEMYSNSTESPPPVSTVTNEHSPNLIASQQQRTASRQSNENYYVEIV